MSVVSLIAIAPSAFASDHEVTIENAAGSSTPGCEPNCFIPNPVSVEVGAIITWANTDTQIIQQQLDQQLMDQVVSLTAA